MKVGILIDEQYQELEAWYPYYRLLEEGMEVFFIGPERGKVCKGKYGYPAEAKLSARDVRGSDLDAVLVPGGFAPDFMRRYPDPARIVREVFEHGGLVAAICHGGWIPASAGILKGRKATCFSAIRDDLIHAGARYFDEEVVVDGNLITSRKPEDLPAFAREILKWLRNPVTP